MTNKSCTSTFRGMLIVVSLLVLTLTASSTKSEEIAPTEQSVAAVEAIKLSLPTPPLSDVTEVNTPVSFAPTNVPGQVTDTKQSPNDATNALIANPPLTSLDLPPQTVNGYTATLESFYADASRLIFQLRVTGSDDISDGEIGNISLEDEHSDFINASISWGAPDRNSSNVILSQIEFQTVAPLPENHLRGQLLFSYIPPPGEGKATATFRFTLDIPVHPAPNFNPKQSVIASGVEILLDRVVIAPAYTQAILCYNKPTDADWTIYDNTKLKIGDSESEADSYSLLFDSAMDTKTEEIPGWTPPLKEGRCVKVGFRVGAENPKSLTLTILTLEQSMPEVIPTEQLEAAYSKLLAQGIDMEWHLVDHGANADYKKLPNGMTEQEAMRKFVEALGYVYEGPL